MTKAEVKLTISPTDFNLIVRCLEGERDACQDLIDNPAVKGKDSASARAELVQINSLLKNLQ